MKSGSAGIPAGSGGSPSRRSRGYLPHIEADGVVQAITFRLHDAVPANVIDSWKREMHWLEGLPASDPREAELRRRLAKYEDAGHGQCWLGDKRIASLVEGALLHFDGDRYRLLACCIMPNHVHTLIETFAPETWERRLPAGQRAAVPPRAVSSIVHSWKSFTATRGNQILRRRGPFWFREYFDRYMRDDRHLAAAISYIEQNPVAAGLVKRAEEWQFGSAGRRPARMPALPR